MGHRIRWWWAATKDHVTLIDRSRLCESRCGELNVAARYVGALGGGAPVARLFDDLADDRFTAVLGELIPLGSLDHRRKTWAVICLVEVQDMFGLVQVGIEVECRRQAPTRCR